jgi:antitoxin component of RelBE/YafQ-DinJ toxin-antitoxin module
MGKKDRLVVIKISQYDKERLFDFAALKGITVSELIRHSVRKVINEQNKK